MEYSKESIAMANRLISEAQAVQGAFKLSEDGEDAGSVGAAVLTVGGNIYTGICIDLACGIGFCAEHSAIADMLKYRETQITMVVACNSTKVLPPCGRCRELMMQINPKNAHAQVIVSQDTLVKLKDLIPYYWNS